MSNNLVSRMSGDEQPEEDLQRPSGGTVDAAIESLRRLLLLHYPDARARWGEADGRPYHVWESDSPQGASLYLVACWDGAGWALSEPDGEGGTLAWGRSFVDAVQRCVRERRRTWEKEFRLIWSEGRLPLHGQRQSMIFGHPDG